MGDHNWAFCASRSRQLLSNSRRVPGFAGDFLPTRSGLDLGLGS
jgi:hypothetical protein